MPTETLTLEERAKQAANERCEYLGPGIVGPCDEQVPHPVCEATQHTGYLAILRALEAAVAQRDGEWKAAFAPDASEALKQALAELTPLATINEFGRVFADEVAQERAASRARIVALDLSLWPEDVRPYRELVLAAHDARTPADAGKPEPAE